MSSYWSGCGTLGAHQLRRADQVNLGRQVLPQAVAETIAYAVMSKSVPACEGSIRFAASGAAARCAVLAASAASLRRGGPPARLAVFVRRAAGTVARTLWPRGR
jgi:hypothetical protein